MHQTKYTKSDWINNELSRYFNVHPTNTYTQAQEGIQTGIDSYLNKLREDIKLDWKDSYLQKTCKEIRKSIRNNNQRELSVYNLHNDNISTIVNDIAFYLKGFAFFDLLRILESVSLHKDVDNTYDDVTLNWGQCILGFIAQNKILIRCDVNNQYRYGQMTKETIVGALC